MNNHDNDDCPHLVRANLLEAEMTRLKAEVDALKLGSLLTAVDVLQFINLKAEVERLRASSFVTAVPIEEYEKLKAERDAAKRCWDSMKEEWDKLVDENIRLRKAGDLLAFHYVSLGKKFFPEDPLPYSIENWNAAKEGKPSV